MKEASNESNANRGSNNSKNGVQKRTANAKASIRETAKKSRRGNNHVSDESENYDKATLELSQCEQSDSRKRLRSKNIQFKAVKKRTVLSKKSFETAHSAKDDNCTSNSNVDSFAKRSKYFDSSATHDSDSDFEASGCNDSSDESESDWEQRQTSKTKQTKVSAKNTSEKRQRKQVNKLQIKKAKNTNSQSFNFDKNSCDEVMSTLFETESKYFEQNSGNISAEITQAKDSSENDNSENDDWEEVENVDECDLSNYKPKLPEEGVQITVEMPEMVKKAKKKTSVDDLLRQQINRMKKENQQNIHKTYLLCSIARGLFMIDVVKNDLIRALSFSHLKNEFLVAEEINLSFVKNFLHWFRKNFTFIEESSRQPFILNKEICKALQTRETRIEIIFILTFFSLLLSMKSVKARVCLAVNPPQLRPTDLVLSEKQREKQKSTKPSNEQKEKAKQTQTWGNSNKKRRKVISSEDDEIIVESNRKVSAAKNTIRCHWLEIYLTSEKKWVCCDPISSSDICEPSELEKSTFDPILYVFAFDNESHVKDVTKRYCSKWLNSVVKAKRVNEQWLTETLQPFKTWRIEEDDIEDKQLALILSEKPLPSTLSEFKNHPLYALEKHLLKYEVIYPPDAPKIGEFRGSAIYSREHVHTVHSQIYWRRFGRIVKKDAVPYKISTARPKWDKWAKKFVRDLPLELFGYWQTEPFMPEEAKDGKVPRNEFGNVELFQPTMLPKGTVHLKLPGLLRIANKLNIDCVPAVVGFDCHSGGGGTHPVYDGFVVCEQFKEILIAAYDEEEENSRKREEEKKMKRIYANWRKLIKGALIRQRLKKKYRDED
ncbi:XPC-like protein isoform b [Dinothrombium tinctorium]|uniref:XPC-like protein isoform b n=1 Tax=Dinothrombium tinctorium TaxID=1965070 RepID=A0A443R5D3_9ACAR|nr:XPC-like protein isoform b [Dinothrombium tinctorium]